MIELIPAILPETFEEIQDKVGIVASKALSIQVDLVDGEYLKDTPRTWPFYAENILDELARLRTLESLEVFELDLMVKNASDDMNQWIGTGASRLIFHMDAEERLVENLEECLASLRGIERGLAIASNADMDRVSMMAPYFDFIQVMGITTVGLQGQSFDPGSLETITYIKEHFPDMVISVDGAVNEDTIIDFIQAGATRLVSGSAIFRGDAVANFDTLNEMIQ